MTERVVLERGVTEDAVTGRVTVEHFVAGDLKVGPDVGPDVALEGGLVREARGGAGLVVGSAAVEGGSISGQEKR